MKHDYDSDDNKWRDQITIEESERTKLRSENSRLHQELEECRKVLKEIVAEPERTGYYWIVQARRLVDPEG
jgi:predicted nuclease with TOPRIM domain